MAKMEKGIDVVGGPEDDVAAPTTVSAVRTAFGDELLAPETQAPVPALAGFNM